MMPNAAPSATIVVRCDREVTPTGTAGVPAAKWGSASASAKALALLKRSAGSFSNAFATAAATFRGTDFRYLVTSCAGSAMIFMMIA